MHKTAVFYIILIYCLISLLRAAPQPQSDVLDPSFDALSNQNVDYNAVMNNIKDFFTYLPVMFSTFRESMSGFPKLAESIRILASPNYEEENDCNCKAKSLQNTNDIEKSLNDL